MTKKYVPPKWEKVQGKVDSSAPRLMLSTFVNPRLLNSITRETRYQDLVNLDIARKLFAIHVNGGKTNTFRKNRVQFKSNIEQRIKYAEEIEDENRALASRIEAMRPKVQTIEELAAEWEKFKRAIEEKRKFRLETTLLQQQEDEVAIKTPLKNLDQLVTKKSFKYSDRRPRVAIEVSVDGIKCLGRMKAVLYSDYVPRICKAFLTKCSPKGKSYKGCRFKNIFPGFFCVTESLSDEIFNDFSEKDFSIAHNKKGMLSMFLDQRVLAGWRFMITFKPLPCMDGKYVAIGQICEGLKTVEGIESFGTPAGFAMNHIFISDIREI